MLHPEALRPMPTQYRLLKHRVGWIGYVATPRGLRRVLLPARTRGALEREITREFPDAEENPRLLPELARAYVRYFDGKETCFTPRFDWTGRSDFDTDVWRACARIPYGRTATYAELAAAVGRPGAARAVGSAMGRNPCPIAVPCHRVVRSDGSLGGYSGSEGVSFKRRLLEMEVANPGAGGSAGERA